MARRPDQTPLRSRSVPSLDLKKTHTFIFNFHINKTQNNSNKTVLFLSNNSKAVNTCSVTHLHFIICAHRLWLMPQPLTANEKWQAASTLGHTSLNNHMHAVTNSRTLPPLKGYFLAACDPVGGVHCESLGFALPSHVSQHVDTHRQWCIIEDVCGLLGQCTLQVQLPTQGYMYRSLIALHGQWLMISLQNNVPVCQFYLAVCRNLYNLNHLN